MPRHCELDLLALVLDLLGLGVGLLLALLTSTKQAPKHIETAALLDAALGQQSITAELLAAEDYAGVISGEACTGGPLGYRVACGGNMVDHACVDVGSNQSANTQIDPDSGDASLWLAVETQLRC